MSILKSIGWFTLQLSAVKLWAFWKLWSVPVGLINFDSKPFKAISDLNWAFIKKGDREKERGKDSNLFLCKDNFGNSNWQHKLKVLQSEIALKAKAKKITLSAFPSSAFSQSKCRLPAGPLKPQGTRSLFKLYHFGNRYSILYTTCWGKEEWSISPTSWRKRCAYLSFISTVMTTIF